MHRRKQNLHTPKLRVSGPLRKESLIRKNDLPTPGKSFAKFSVYVTFIFYRKINLETEFSFVWIEQEHDFRNNMAKVCETEINRLIMQDCILSPI